MNRTTRLSRGTVNQTPCELCPLRSSSAFRPFAPHEFDFVRGLKTAELTVSPGTSVLLEGTGSDHLYTVLSGWGFRYKALDDGRRQILNYVLPGDFLGLQAATFEEMRHSVEALSEMTLCVFPRERLWSLYRDHPSLAVDLTWITARQEVILDENLLSLGRRSARERVAYLLLHLYRRAKEVRLAADGQVALPFTQQHFADALGLSLVHTNKTLKRLANDGLAHWRGGKLTVLDYEGMSVAGNYDPKSEKPRPFI